MVVLYVGLVFLYVCRTNVCSNGGCPVCTSSTSSLVYMAGSPVCRTGSTPISSTCSPLYEGLVVLHVGLVVLL